MPREYGGADVSYATVVEVIAMLSAFDSSIGQLPQNHFCLLEDLRRHGTEAQKEFYYKLVLKGNRFANAISESSGEHVQDVRTTLHAGSSGLVINGRKSYCTGSMFAHWLGVLVIDETGNPQLAFVEQGR